jgi:hydroxypyruvate reductase
LAQLRQDAAAIFSAAVKAADPLKLIQRHVRLSDTGVLWAGAQRYELSRYDAIHVIGAGKASARMALAMEQLLGDRICDGVVNVKYGHSLPLERIKIHEAGHPIPDEAGIRGTAEVVHLSARTGERELIIFLLSGGASALLTCPAEGLTLEDKQRTTEKLLRSGAGIEEINAVRKHLSKVKGGRLARLSYPAALVSLILSDVVGDPLDAIGSGPTAPDTKTFADCWGVIERYRVREEIPPAALALLKRGVSGEIDETPKAGDPAFEHVQNFIIGNNSLALASARETAEALGYHTILLADSLAGEAIEAGRAHAQFAKNILSQAGAIPRPACVISGGETTVKVRGTGLGGRNQEFALAAAIEIHGYDEIVILSGGTDGTDGPTDAAGAVVDGSTVRRARTMGLDAQQFLTNNDSYHFLQPVGDLLITGPTFTNVMDLRLILVA